MGWYKKQIENYSAFGSSVVVVGSAAGASATTLAALALVTTDY